MSEKILANIFVDGVVLQSDLPINIWGKVKKNAQVCLTFDETTYETTASSSGSFCITIPALPALPVVPHKIIVESGKNRQEVNDILIGDVWLCSGQSNMELPMSRTKRMFSKDHETTYNPYIRKYHVPMTYNFHEPQTEIPETTWIKAIPGQTEKFTATGFYFANKLYEQTKIPIGLILSALGGTPVESWMSAVALDDYPDLLALTTPCKKTGYLQKKELAGQKANDEWHSKVNQFDRGINEKWYEESFDDRDWQTIDLTTPWDEVTNLKASGSIWLRKVVEITQEQVLKPADIILGCIADADEVYVNGKQIGGTAYRYPPRDYPVLNLKIGKNTIAVRVLAINGMGEFVFDKEHKLLFSDNTQIPLSNDWRYKRALTCPPLAESMPCFQNLPTGNYNGMIAPFHNFAIKGVIWYQGESNAADPTDYSKKFSTMITDWRQNWQQGDFPFIFAQLANWSPKGKLMHWERLRDEQTKTLATPNTRMVVTNDLGEHNDLHPLNKKAVGERLANEALSLAYGENIIATGPTITSIKKIDQQLLLTFNTYKSKLKLKQGEVVYGLAVWIDDIEIPVEGSINDATSVIINHHHQKAITAVSYAWIDDPAEANLYNEACLPAVPFKQEI